MATCKHQGKKIGKAECGCAGTFSVYYCNLLETPAMPFPATPLYLHHENGPIEPNPDIIQCNQCSQNTTGTNTHLPPNNCK